MTRRAPFAELGRAIFAATLSGWAATVVAQPVPVAVGAGEENHSAAPAWPTNWAEPRVIDPARLQSAGLRVLSARHVTLVTDLPSTPEVDRLPSEFDTAYAQFCAFFGVPETTVQSWRMHAYLMVDRARFDRAGALHEQLPKFANGFAWGADCWFYEQPTAYYRRHLLLHEATHGFMNTRLAAERNGGSWPPWIVEGLAELLATHRLAGDRVTLHYLPRARSETPHWGRIKLVRDAVAAGRRPTIDEVLATTANTQLENEIYAWCWALCTLLDDAPRYHERFRLALGDLMHADFNRSFKTRFADVWPELSDDWQELTATLEYGHDIRRSAIEFQSGAALPAGGGDCRIAADRGWQSTGYRLTAGQAYRITAQGQFEIARTTRPWLSTAAGVTLRYHAGRPLGQLLAVVRPDDVSGGRPSAFVAPLVIGAAGTIRPVSDGTLYLKVNDSPAELADNAGALSVTIAPGL